MPDNIPDNIAHPFDWLEKIIKEPSHQSIFFYRQHGIDEKSAIYPSTEPDPVRRISKGENDIAVIKQSEMEFVVRRVKTHGHTN